MADQRYVIVSANVSGEGLAARHKRRRTRYECISRRGHRLESGKRPAGRDPHLCERVVLGAVQFDRRALRLERETTLSSQLVQVVERAPTDRRRLGPFRGGYAGRDAASIQLLVMAVWES